jgi:hypothetical protein
MSDTIDAAEVVNEQALATRQAGAAQPPEPARPAITAAQAKVDAVAALTATAYARAATLELTPEESEKLQADFPDEAFKPGAGGKESLIYIEHAFLRDRFTQVFGMGRWAMVPRSRWAEPFKTGKGVDGSRVYVEAMLVIRGCFVAEAIGEMEYYPSNGSQNYGDAVEGAESAAFRRCAKKFGVGLQAWKKDWCTGWWQRKNTVQRPPPAFAQRPTAAPPRAAAPASAPTPAAPKAATDKTREWFLANVGNEDYALQFCIDLAWLMPNEKLADLGLRFVPTSKEELEAFKSHMGRWVESGRAEPPYKTGEVEAPAPAPKSAAAPRPSKDDEWWREIVVVVPRKGMKRDEYLRNPDTIGSLFEARHGEDDESQAARRRLFGFVSGYEPKGWVKHDGTQMPPNKADIEFRTALDAFKDWYDRNHPGEKL